MDKVIVGQKYMVERLMIGLLADGHILLEGVPGLAKTLAINTLAKAINAGFQPYPIHPRPIACGFVGHHDLQPKKEEFIVRKGPVILQLYFGG